MQKTLFFTILFILAYFIYFTEGVAFNIFTAWNMLPLFVSFLIYRFGSGYSAYSFLSGSMMLSGYLHLAWMFGWGDINSDSTSALIFVVIPIFSLVAGGIGYAVGRRFKAQPGGGNNTNR
jgi:hypothetical protein